MNKRLKIGALAACISFIALSLLLVYPSGPTSRMRGVVIAAPTFDNQTRIHEIRIYDNTSPTKQLVGTFTENNQTVDIDVGVAMGEIWIYAYVDNEYVPDNDDCYAVTRFTLTIDDPSDNTQYDNDALWFEDSSQQNGGTYWEVIYTAGFGPGWIVLTEGTWTITTKYEVYA